MTNDYENEFSVYQFFDGSCERVLTNVSAEEANKAAEFCTKNVNARVGFITERVIIMDDRDHICFEWIYGKGIIFPTKEFFDSLTNTEKETD